MTSKPGVLFVCVKNGGKSQMAGGLMRHLTKDAVTVYTAGTKPGSSLNSQSVESLVELGIDMGAEHTKPITPDMLGDVSLIVTLGSEAVVDPVPGIEIRNWDTDEPSERGIEGMERMRLVRDDISIRVSLLAQEMLGSVGS
ncbi:arsenate-mycothiol transferase ArsC [Arthrobacter glacialis]|uniref:Phosphatase n=1 Tax=Arthrobacter glacialis TaxID=1664 RepID=A0A2S3ZSB4_ARTGL|nr:low molecular weight phosphatase family protein [Arthrobacter glacialis]POH71882.1 phosphatase [Arthrobacter glacialis]